MDNSCCTLTGRGTSSTPLLVQESPPYSPNRGTKSTPIGGRPAPPIGEHLRRALSEENIGTIQLKSVPNCARADSRDLWITR